MEILSLSVNKIETLAAFRTCVRLRELYLRKNNIKSLHELIHLVRNDKASVEDMYIHGNVSDSLQVLWLCDNPCSSEQDYRGKVIALLPKLTKLDNLDVTKKERDDAEERQLGKILLEEIAKQEQLELNRSVEEEEEDDDETRNQHRVQDNKPMESSQSVHCPNEDKDIKEQDNNLSVPPPTSSNVLYAVMALVADLDLESLRIIQSEVDHRIEESLNL